jgi:hypothetical protein
MMGRLLQPARRPVKRERSERDMSVSPARRAIKRERFERDDFPIATQHSIKRERSEHECPNKSEHPKQKAHSIAERYDSSKIANRNRLRKTK